MATAEQLKALLKSYSDGDESHFLSIAMQIASHEARSGKGKLAVALRELIDKIKQKHPNKLINRAIPIARPSGELSDILTVSYPHTLLSEMILTERVLDILKRILTENRQKVKLNEFGLSPRRKILLIGPPGCGKTMTAFALAGEMKLPLFTIQLHSTITKFMGETAVKLHSIFNSMEKMKGVYLFDEFDAIGAHRSSNNDVGEIRRVLNSFLQFLESDNSDSIIIGATNYVDLIDSALFRRFDDIINYEIPTNKQVKGLIENRLISFKLQTIVWNNIYKASSGLSHAEIVRACDDAAKKQVLKGKQNISEKNLVESFQCRFKPDQTN